MTALSMLKLAWVRISGSRTGMPYITKSNHAQKLCRYKSHEITLAHLQRVTIFRFVFQQL